MFKRNNEQSQQRPPLTGQRLRSYAFALLTRRDYSKAELIEKLARYAQNIEEVNQLVEELSEQNYQSDQRVAEQMLASQIRKGKGPKRIQQALKNKQIENDLIADEIHEIDWVEQAYQLKVKKFGEDIEKDPKLKAKQIRFLQYRGFDLDVILKAIQRKLD
ncbi:regulatory protein RecX [Acinetobacter nosocomialis]|uniref:regulatory protein RecX n=1 Tax=Acinetobacter nosocomialis TaxID=106654 RepID=UPI001250409C|nr:regulatory protein RecX [Acinetobacter nosocomialis]MDB9694015.1 recombination regulator RecX [Acinetobacter nosocomialis]MDM9639421.1 regulatory protein RecX [Acinetobacter nosocomialis]MDO7229244.1 regulatory protein RecX [Acinetobacter nosocomialis]MDP7777130.1 regulatory protein RecX [Acinetobacter nosocomialis]